MQPARKWAAREIPRGAKNSFIDLCDRFATVGYRWRHQTPPPHGIKARVVIEYGRRHNLSVLVETGTYLGDMARKCSCHFREIWTVEMSESLAKEAASRLGRYNNVHVLQSESCEQLSRILSHMN